MTDEKQLRCPLCRLVKDTGQKGSLTQWLVVCRCDQDEFKVETQPDSLKLCSVCGKRISTGSLASLTQWIFRDNVCACGKQKLSPGEDSGTEGTRSFSSGAGLQAALPSTKNSVHESEPDTELSLDPEIFPVERYKAIREIGHGAAGVVYLCRDRLLKKNVAVKCLRSLTDKQLVDFQNEARATSQLNHPGVVAVMDFGVTPSGAPYMVMEYINGVSLERFIQEHGQLPLAMFARTFIKTAEAMAHAHDKGIFHRDLKSSNIILVDADTPQTLEPKVIDFGIAAVKHASQTPTVVQGMTIVGTPLYMAPDQVSGLPYTERSEIYALGCVMYEALTGRPPFQGDTALETIGMHANTAPLSLKEARNDLVFDEKLEHIVVTRCLAKDPSQRFKSMNELKVALGKAASADQRGDPLPIDTTSSGTKSFSIRAVATVVVLAIVLLGAAVFIYENLSHDSPYYTALARKSLYEGDTDKAIEHASKALEGNEGNVAAADVKSIAYLLQGEKEKALTEIDRAIKLPQPVADSTQPIAMGTKSGELRYHRAAILHALGRQDEAKRELLVSSEYSPTTWELEKFPELKQKTTAQYGIEAMRKAYVHQDASPYETSLEGKPNSAYIKFATDKYLEALVKRKPKLRQILLADSRVTQAGLKCLARLPFLEHVGFKEIHIEDQELSVLGAFPSLVAIDFFDCPKVHGEFIEHVTNTTVKELYFRGNGLHDNSLRFLKAGSNIDHFTVLGCKTFSGDGFALMRRTTPSVIGWTVALETSLLNDEAMQYPEHVVLKMSKANPTWAILNSDALPEAEFFQLPELKATDTLTLRGKLKLSFAKVAAINRMPALRMLRLEGPQIDEQGLLGRSRFGQPIMVGFYDTGIKDVDLRRLKKLKLNGLALKESKLTRTAFEIIGDMETLTILDLHDMDASADAEIKRLQKKLPKANIRVY